MDSTTDLLVIVLDTNPSQCILREKPDNLSKILQSVITFANSHLMLSSQNKLAVLSVSHHSTDYLYPLEGRKMDVRPMDGQYEVFYLVEKALKIQLGELMLKAPKLTSPCESLIAGSMSMALCYIARQKRELPAGNKLHSRILVITGSSECPSKSLTYMNVFNAAQKMGVVIDTCALDKPLPLLSQGTDLTKGYYLKVDKLDKLLHHLQWILLPAPRMRYKLVLPPQPQVDCRAACFCHLEPVSIGHVCDNCLSVFCEYIPICTTCKAVFKPQSPMQMAIDDKKEEEEIYIPK